MTTLRSLAVSARYLSREECEAIAKRALSFATAEETRVLINSTSLANTRFAVNQISTGGDSFDSVVTVVAKFGKKSGSSSTNRLDDDGLRAAVQMAERVAKLSPDDPESLPELGPQTYQPGVNWSDTTARRAGVARDGREAHHGAGQDGGTRVHRLHGRHHERAGDRQQGTFA